ncbi:MAG TPA: hypothetical protein VMT73_06620 [Anaerolineales bacterium]|nr:hypothetical protein [Anaerolineales bacterium]
MPRLVRILLVFGLALFVLACGMISNPINNVKGLASTAEAFATSNPIGTLQAFASAMPTFTGMMDPQGQPVSDWNGVPVMPQATAGQQFSDHNYSFKVPAAASDVQAFYTQKMKDLGWTSLFSTELSTEGGIMVFQKDSDTVSIFLAADTNDSNNVIVILQK